MSFEPVQTWLIGNAPWLAALANIATALGVLAILGAGLSFWRGVLEGRARARSMHAMQVRAMEDQRAASLRQTYEALDEKYIAFQHLALAHPRLNVAETQMTPAPELTADEIYQRRVLYSILLSIFERAFTTYKGVEDHGLQWEGWAAFLDHYLQREAFREAYWNAARRPNGDPTWDENFVAYLNGRLGGAPSRDADEPS